MLDRNIRTAYNGLYKTQDVKKMLEISREDLLVDISHRTHTYLARSIERNKLTPQELEEIFRDVIVYIACTTENPRGFLYSLSLTLNGFTDEHLEQFQKTVRQFNEP